MPNVALRRVAASQILDLRHAVLRTGLPRASACFNGDDDPRTVHIAASIASAAAGFPAVGGVVGCCSFMPSDDLPDEVARMSAQPAWQLRGMAVEPGCQGSGIGRLLLKFADQLLPTVDPARSLWWCNARVPAAAFYQRLGWQIVSDPFDIPTAGPHVRMVATNGAVTTET